MTRELLDERADARVSRDRSLLHLCRFDDQSMSLCGHRIKPEPGEDPADVECVVCAQLDRAFPVSDPPRGPLEDALNPGKAQPRTSGGERDGV